MRTFCALPLALGLFGCGSPEPEPEPDVTVALDVYPTDFIAENTPMNVLVPGAVVRLVSAPQGGHVIHVGARVRGLENDRVNIRARIRVPETNVIQAEEARDVSMIPVSEELDLKQNDFTSVSQLTHIPACPDYDAIDIVDRAWNLEVIVREVGGPGLGSATIGIELGCLQTDLGGKAQCQCECEKNYVLGKCVGDAGAPSDGGAG